MIAKAIKGTSLEKWEALEKILRRRIKPGTREFERLFAMLKNLNPDNPYEIEKFLSMTRKHSLWDYPRSIYYNSLLSGVPTQIVNFLGNLTMGAMEGLFVKPVSYILEMPVKAVKNIVSKEKQPLISPLLGYYQGLGRGFLRGLGRAFRTIKTGFDPEEMVNPSKWERIIPSPWTASEKKVVRGVGRVIETPTNLLKAVDSFFDTMFREARVTELAYKKVWNPSKSLKKISEEAARILEDLPEDLLKEAQRYADYITHKDPADRITKVFLQLKRIPVFEPIIPFVRVAGALVRKGVIDYGPAGLVKLKGSPQKAEQIARSLLGTLILASGALLYKLGYVETAPPKTRGERQKFYELGKQAWSLKIPTKDGWYYLPVRRADVIALPFMIGALIAKNIEEGKLKGKKVDEIIFNTAAELGKLITDASYLEGIERLYNAFAGYGERGEELERLLAQTAAGFVPFGNLLEDIAITLDPEIAEREFGSILLAKIPGLRERAKKRLGVFGEPVEYMTAPLGTWFPFAPSKHTDDPVWLELERLDHTIGFPSRRLKGKRLSDEEYRAYLTVSGNIIRDVLEDLIHTDYYQNLSDNDKRKSIDRVVREVRSLVAENLFSEFRIYRYIYDYLRDRGLSEEESYYYADKLFDKMKDDGVLERLAPLFEK